MKRITLAMVAIALTAAAGAQVPPTPPAARPAQVAPRPETRPTPPAPPAARADWYFDFDREAVRRAAEIAHEMSRVDIEQTRHAVEMAREMSRIDAEQLRLQSGEIARAAREASRLAIDEMRLQAPRAHDALMDAQHAMESFHYTPTPPMPAMAPMAPMADFSFSFGNEGLRTRPPQAWAQGDPADSLYRLASESNSRGDYRRAAQLFSDLTQKYPRSVYVGEALYWEAFSRYRLGSNEELERAAKALEALSAKGSEVRRRGSDGDVEALKARVYGALAQRGVRGYSEKLSSIAGNASCDKEDVSVRAEALNALGRMDPGAAMPYIRRVLEKKDECSADLRQKAVFMLGQRGDPEATSALIAVAKSDPSPSVRSDAISWLPRLPGDAPFSALEDILRSDTDTRIQRAAIRALNSSDNPKARQSIRALIDRKDAPEQFRIEAINSFDKERTTDNDAKYLRDLYGRVDSDRLREAIVNSVGRLGGSENDQWIISLAKNPNTPDPLRASAVSRLGRMTTVPISDLIKLYDVADTRSMRDQLINVFANRKEQEATDKLFQIVRNSTTDYIARRNAMQALTRKGTNDPKIMQLLFDIVDKKPLEEKKP